MAEDYEKDPGVNIGRLLKASNIPYRFNLLLWNWKYHQQVPDISCPVFASFDLYFRKPPYIQGDNCLDKQIHRVW